VQQQSTPAILHTSRKPTMTQFRQKFCPI
jgi:hypothetical protein